MAANGTGWTLNELAPMLGGTVRGDGSQRVLRPVPAGEADPDGIAFAGNEKYLAEALSVPIGAIIVSEGLDTGDVPAIISADPRLSFYRLLALVHRPLPLASGIHPTAVVAETARVDSTAKVGPYAVVEHGAEIGAGAKVYAHAYVGENCRVGDGSILFPHVVLYQDVILGQRCIVHSHVTVGADGFGFLWDGTAQRKVPHVGGVVIGDDVEIGANTTIDRATSGNTHIGDGVKLDNLVQIAHNDTIGKHTVIAAQVGVGGSSKVGERVTLGGQAGVADHITIADNTIFAGRSGVTNDIEEAGAYSGFPARPIAEARRILASTLRLPEFAKRLRSLERGVGGKE